jgi:hypothetical protein
MSNRISVRNENWNHYNQSSEHDYVNAIARHLPKLRLVKLVRDPISVGIDPERELVSVYFVVMKIR